MILRLLIAACLLCACEERRAAPAPTAVEPRVVGALVSTPAVVVGSLFFDSIGPVSLGDDERPEVDRAWTVRIGDLVEVDAERESEQRVAFTVPAGLAVGVYDVHVVAPDGQEGTVPDGLFVVAGPVELALSVETAADGTGDPVGERSVTIGDSTALFAVLRNSGEFIATATDAAWSVDEIGVVDPETGERTNFEATTPGTGFVTVRSEELSARAGPFRVAPVAPVTSVRIDDAPGGLGAEVGNEALVVDDTLELHAVEVDETGAFVADVEVMWTTTGGVGTIPAGPASSATFLATGPGTGRVRATSPTLGDDETGDLVVDDAPPPPVVTLVAEDPLGDGSRRASVFRQGTQIVVGPSDDGTGAQAMDGDGTRSMRRDFSFLRDSIDNRSSNLSAAPYPSIGFTGCRENTPECGPDNENGRGLFGGATLGGVDWMIVGGAQDPLEYVYMTPGDEQFRYVDLDAFLGGSTFALTAMHAYEGDLYLGFSDGGGSRPFFTRLRAQPDVPGLNATDSHATNLLGADLPNIRRVDDGVVMLDTIWDFGDRLYTANASVWVRSQTRTPQPADDGESWVDITPGGSLYTSAPSVLADPVRDVESADRAVPFMATYRGRLYVARNTEVGPQLWVCDPSVSGPAAHCDSGDFSVVAGNDLEPKVTTFDNSNNTAITLLAATAEHLYVGFDNALDGVTVFRTSAETPLEQADFEGEASCSAEEHPACEGLGGNGFGNPTNRIIFDARAISLPAGQSVFLTVGDGVIPVRVYRLAP